MSSEQPIRVFYGHLSNTFWATQHWKERPHPSGNGTIIEITGKRWDVTQDIARIIVDEGVEFTPVSESEEVT